MRQFRALLLAAAALGTAPFASAQTPPADAAAAPASGLTSGLGDIVVTARKRAESVQNVPIAVSAIAPEQLDRGFTPDLRDLAGRVPSLVVDTVTAGPSAAAISIRGISFEDIEKSFEPAIGVVLDGVFIGTNTGQLLDTFDLAGLEVLRGPQGTLFGRNTIGGVINVTRTRPTGELGGKVAFGYSSFNTKQGRLVINSPKLGDVLALKGFAFYDKTDGFISNLTRNVKEPKYETLSLGVTGLITPTETLTALLTYEHSRERGETVGTTLSVTGRDVICLAIPNGAGGFIRPFAPATQCDRINLPARGGYESFSNVQGPVTNDTDAVTANITLALGEFNLTSVTGWRRNKEDVRQDFDATSINFFDTRRRQTYRQISEELRLDGKIGDNISGVVGGYYFDSSYTLLQNTFFGPGVLAPVPVALRQDSSQKSKSYAAFGEFDFKLGERVTLVAGGRYSRDEKSVYNNFGAPAVLVPNGQCLLANQALCRKSASFEKFTWRASASYKIDDDRLLYVSYSTGYRAGGFNGRAGSPTSFGPYEPESVGALELGIKADWLDNRLRTNAAIFQTRYNNAQEEVVQRTPVGSASPQETVVSNAGKKRITGFELEVLAKPVPEFTVNASLSYLNAKYVVFLNDLNGDLIPDDASALTPRRAPRWTFSVGGEYSAEFGSGRLDVNAGLRFVDKYQTTIVPDPVLRLQKIAVNDPRGLAEPRTLVDAAISYTQSFGSTEARFTVFGRNLFNNRGLAAALPVAGLFTFGNSRPPRSIGAEAQVKF